MESKNIIGLGFLGAAAFLALKSEKSIQTSPNPKRKSKAKKCSNPRRRWKHSVPDSAMYMVLSSLAYLNNYGHMSENVPDKTLSYLVKEKWYDVDKQEVTDLGREFLAWAGADSDDGEVVPDDSDEE